MKSFQIIVLAFVLSASGAAFAQQSKHAVREDSNDPCSRFKLKVLEPTGAVEYELRVREPDAGVDFKGRVFNPCAREMAQLAQVPRVYVYPRQDRRGGFFPVPEFEAKPSPEDDQAGRFFRQGMPLTPEMLRRKQ